MFFSVVDILMVVVLCMCFVILVVCSSVLVGM